MSITPISTWGPVQDIVNDNTIAYTLTGAQTASVGDSLILYLGAAGVGGAVPTGAADTKGNVYSVDAAEAPSGSAIVGVLLGRITHALVAGDTITVTVGANCTDKNLLIRRVTSTNPLVKDIAAVNGAGGAGTTTPNVSTSPTSDTAPDYIALITVWNGASVLTEDTHYTSLLHAHFDNVGTAQTKQMSVMEHLAPTIGVQGATHTLTANQPWAMALVCYKETTAPPPGSIIPVQSIGPGQDVTNTTSLVYTLAAGESAAIGETLLLMLASAGAPGAIATAVSDSKGNTYGIIATSAPGGGALASGARSKITTALVPGDVITVTFGAACTDKLLLGRVVSGLSGIGDQTGTGGVGGAGGTAVNFSTLLATTDAVEYAIEMVVWNGNSGLTVDASYDPVYQGHFDNASIPQTKQVSIREKITSTAGIQSVTETIASNQAWAGILMTFHAMSGGGGGFTAKRPAQGLSIRDGDTDPNGYVGSFSNGMFRVYWDTVQPTDAAVLDAREVARIKKILDDALAAGETRTIRIFAGYRAPAWEKAKVGTWKYQDPAGTGNPTVTVPKFWTTTFLNDWDRLQMLLAAQFDAHPALRGVQIALGMTYYAEPMIRGLQAAQNRAELVGGGPGWDGTRIPVPGAGFTAAKDIAALKAGIDIHAARWPNTPGHMAINPYQKLTSYTSYLPGDDATITNTKEIIDYLVSALGPTGRCVLENNSVRASYFHADGTLVTTSKYGQMYQYMVSKGQALYYQVAGASVIGNFNKTMAGVVGPLKGNAAEPTNNHGASPYDAANLAYWNQQLLANPLPTPAGGSYAPLSTGVPIVTQPGATGYTPGSVLRTTMGTWDGGTHAITAFDVYWIRVDPVTFARTTVQHHTLASPFAHDDYTIVVGDDGFELISEITATNSDGVGLPRDSAATPIITTAAPAAPINTSLPSISPISPGVGDLLSINHGIFTSAVPIVSYQYTFQRSNDGGTTWNVVQIGNDPTYPLTVDDVGYQFEPVVIASNGVNSAPATGNPTGPVADAPTTLPPYVGEPAIGTRMPAWLRIDGIEIANWARVFEYLKSGQGASGITLQAPDACAILYQIDGAQQTYLDPSLDPAPWYDPARPETAQFLGIVVNTLQIEPVSKRAPTDLAGRYGGSSLSPTATQGRRLNVSATIVAASCSGADFGYEWLSSILGDPGCDTCDVSTVEYREVCPPDDGTNDQLGYWIAYGAGIIAGPTIGAQDLLCNFTDVSWQWACESAYLYKAPVLQVEATILNPQPSAPDCIAFDAWLCGPGVDFGCTNIAAPPSGTVAPIITIYSPDGVGGIEISTNSVCPPAATDLPESSILVVGLQGTLIIDCARHLVTYISPDGSVIRDGTDHLNVPAGTELVWPEVDYCDSDKCICISTTETCSGGENTTVQIETQFRRR